jgi:hypothetical protein
VSPGIGPVDLLDAAGEALVAGVDETMAEAVRRAGPLLALLPFPSPRTAPMRLAHPAAGATSGCPL